MTRRDANLRVASLRAFASDDEDLHDIHGGARPDLERLDYSSRVPETIPYMTDVDENVEDLVDDEAYVEEPCIPARDGQRDPSANGLSTEEAIQWGSVGPALDVDRHPKFTEPVSSSNQYGNSRPHGKLKKSLEIETRNMIAEPGFEPRRRDTDALKSDLDKKRNKLGYERISIDCAHCRRRRIRCVVPEDDPEQRCNNCIRSKRECVFYPVGQQAIIDARMDKSNNTLELSDEQSSVASYFSLGISDSSSSQPEATHYNPTLQVTVYSEPRMTGYHQHRVKPIPTRPDSQKPRHSMEVSPWTTSTPMSKPAPYAFHSESSVPTVSSKVPKHMSFSDDLGSSVYMPNGTSTTPPLLARRSDAHSPGESPLDEVHDPAYLDISLAEVITQAAGAADSNEQLPARRQHRLPHLANYWERPYEQQTTEAQTEQAGARTVAPQNLPSLQSVAQQRQDIPQAYPAYQNQQNAMPGWHRTLSKPENPRTENLHNPHVSSSPVPRVPGIGQEHASVAPNSGLLPDFQPIPEQVNPVPSTNRPAPSMPETPDIAQFHVHGETNEESRDFAMPHSMSGAIPLKQ
ncbi:hypothetical protein CB0940_03823 [Cercospora beticola]|uniref:Zn(2)-C6 fungal-type domain-containing protein n=1 Tax=Cercospora beticola TaxID=122368 RepID=A0A2G5I5D9_CERBT|nr:hypothetical protein CB0940_03823 [Cercospora beticola]PIB00026.1 hypothetical protein CB0940_03823 [Cercospora beticola]